MNEDISKKIMDTAVKKGVEKPGDLLIYLVVINRHTGEAEITSFPSFSLEAVKLPVKHCG